MSSFTVSPDGLKVISSNGRVHRTYTKVGPAARFVDYAKRRTNNPNFAGYDPAPTAMWK